VTGTPLPLYSEPFDAARIRVLERGDSLLVMDRVSGAWLAVGAEEKPLLPLVPADSRDLPGNLRKPVASLKELLVEHEVGVPDSERHFESLNTIILKLTNACNYACTYCYDFEEFEKATTLDPQHGRQAISEALDLVDSELCVILHGGEPMLLWPLVEELVEAGEQAAAEKGKGIHFIGQSNFSRLDDRVIEFSERHAIAWGVSVDGTPEAHDLARVDHQGRGTYADFESALERYPEFVRRCGVMTTVTRPTQSRLLEAARHFHDLGMASWDWSLFQPIGRGRSESVRFLLDTDALVASWNELFDAVEAGEFDGFPVLPVRKYLKNFISGPGGNMCMRGECGAARDLLSISASGTVDACDCIDPTGPLAGLGDLDTTGLAAARQSPVAEAIRARDLSAAACADCIWFGVCGGSCLAHAPSLNEVWADGCAVAMNAFDRISASLLEHEGLVRYMQSLPQG
jgi:uncharacterized protein